MRPRVVTEKMRRRAAEKIVDELLKLDGFSGDERDGLIDDIAALRNPLDDGYKLARALEQSHHWDCDMVIAEALDRFSVLCNDELRAAERQWATDNPMEPPFPIGASVKTPTKGVGVITGIPVYAPQSYTISTPEQSPGSAWIIPFEDVRAV